MASPRSIALCLPFLLIGATLVAGDAREPVREPASVTLEAKGPALRLLITGDAGATHSRLRAGIQAVQKDRAIDAIILTGDNFYQCGVASVDDPQWTKITEHFGPAGVPIFPVFGNHDYGDPSRNRTKSDTCASFATNPAAQIEATGTVPGWSFPAENYVVKTAAADLLMIDTQPLASRWDRPFLQSGTADSITSWLQQRLRECKKPWRIVVGHHTIYSSGEHGRTNSRDQQNMRRLLPLLTKGHVDLYLCGHDHDLELLGNLRSRKGPLFLVSGAGSGIGDMRARKPAALKTEPPTLFPDPVSAMFGFAVLEIESARLTITFYDPEGVARSQPFVVEK
ncbi:MAG: metallophosphoesterase [Thermoanaerobaculia bacterium]